MLVKFGTIHFQHFSGLKCCNFTFYILLNSFQHFLLFIICCPFLLILQVIMLVQSCKIGLFVSMIFFLFKPFCYDNWLLVSVFAHLIGYTVFSFFEFANFSPSLQFKYMDIELHLGDEILELIGPSESMDGPKFSIKAAKIGITSLYVSWR